MIYYPSSDRYVITEKYIYTIIDVDTCKICVTNETNVVKVFHDTLYPLMFLIDPNHINKQFDSLVGSLVGSLNAGLSFDENAGILSKECPNKITSHLDDGYKLYQNVDILTRKGVRTLIGVLDIGDFNEETERVDDAINALRIKQSTKIDPTMLECYRQQIEYEGYEFDNFAKSKH